MGRRCCTCVFSLWHICCVCVDRFMFDCLTENLWSMTYPLFSRGIVKVFVQRGPPVFDVGAARKSKPLWQNPDFQSHLQAWCGWTTETSPPGKPSARPWSANPSLGTWRTSTPTHRSPEDITLLVKYERSCLLFLTMPCTFSALLFCVGRPQKGNAVERWTGKLSLRVQRLLD